MMSHLTLPADYQSSLTMYETQTAIGNIKKTFEHELARSLNLKRVSAPLFVEAKTGLNDNLNGIERPVSFFIPFAGVQAEIVHSLAKWKRMALHLYGFSAGEGLYTDMNAVRRDEELDNLHSVYVDQWDWEKVIDRSERIVQTLQDTVRSIVASICETQSQLMKTFPSLRHPLSKTVDFITTQELEDLYPSMSPKDRENAYLKNHPTAFIMQIGHTLQSGIRHDGRAPDYDDWTLNGDLLFRNDVLGCAFEISSMGIRVDETALDQQLTLAECNDRRELPFHRKLLSGELPQSIGGGIGQSRLCMLLLEKAHIGEVQVSVWDEKTREDCRAHNIQLL